MKVLVLCDKAFSLSETFLFHETLLLPGEVHLVARKGLNQSIYRLPSRIKQRYLYRNLLFRLAFKLHSNKFYYPPLVRHYLQRYIRRNKVDVIFAEYGTVGLQGMAVARSCQVPLVVRFHGYDATRMTADQDYLAGLKALFACSAAITAPSAFIGKKLTWLGLSATRLSVIHNTIDPGHFSAERDYSGGGDLKLIHSGRLVQKKGVEDLIEVFSTMALKYPNLSLVIVGDGICGERIRSKVELMNLTDRVEMKGALAHEEVIRLLYEGDIFILNSRVDESGESEGFPVSVLEAMASGLPVVSTRHAGIPEAIRDGETGILVRERDNEALTAAITGLVESPSDRERLGRAARDQILKHFTRDRMKQAFDSLFSEVTLR